MMAWTTVLVHQHCSILATVQLVEFGVGVVFIGKCFSWIVSGYVRTLGNKDGTTTRTRTKHDSTAC